MKSEPSYLFCPECSAKVTTKSLLKHMRKCVQGSPLISMIERADGDLESISKALADYREARLINMAIAAKHKLRTIESDLFWSGSLNPLSKISNEKLHKLKATIPPDMDVCEFCGTIVRAFRMRRHLSKAHDIENKTKIEQEHKAKCRNLALKKFNEQRTKCTICRRKLSFGMIKSHFANIHDSPPPPEMLALLGEYSSENLFRSNRERERYWRNLMGVDQPDSDDIFDRQLVSQGGAYGLGKSRRH